MNSPHGLAIEPAREAPIDMPTKSALPHFGIMANTVRGCLEFDAFDSAVLSERTRRTIAAGDRVNPDTWEEYANEIFTILISQPICPLEEGDRQSLVRAFQSLRSTYEQLSEMLSRHTTPPDAVYRGVMRLEFLDFGLRYFALCQLNNFTPPEGLPLWAQQDGANKFWRAVLEEAFPGLALVGSSNKTGDCASQLEMNPSKMRRCLYENDVPDLDTLKRVFPTPEALGKALRHYAAFRLYRILVAGFGRVEVEFWVTKMVDLVRWLSQMFKQFLAAFPEEKRRKHLKRIMLGGVGDSAMQRLLVKKLIPCLPSAFRADFLAMATMNPMSAVYSYVAFCESIGGGRPQNASWEEGFDCFQVEFDEFQRTGTFPDGAKPSARLQLSRLLTDAWAKQDGVLAERILRRIVEIDPLHKETHQMLAESLEGQGKFEDAWKEYEIAAACDPAFTLPLFSVADSKSKAGRHDEALAVVERIPADVTGQKSFLHGHCLLRAGKYQACIPFLEDAFNQGREPGVSAGLLAHVYENLKSVDFDWLKKSRKWQKLALHHGLTMEMVLQSTLIR